METLGANGADARRVRAAERGDARAVYGLMCQLEEQKFDYGLFEERYFWQLENPAFRGLVLEDAGSVDGFINVRIERQLHHALPVAEITELVVDHTCRGGGRGGMLLDAAIAYAHRQGCEVLDVTSNAKRVDAHRFYERHGMNRTHVKLTMEL